MTQWGSCYSIFSFLCIVGFVLLIIVLSCCPTLLLAIVLSFLLQSMAQWGSCYSIFSFLCSVLQIIVCLVVPLSFCHCIVVPSSIYGLVGFVLLDLWFSVQCFVDHCLSCFFLSFDHCIVVPSSIYGLVGFVLLDLQFSVQCFVDHCLSCCPFLLTIVLSFLLQSMAQWGSCYSIFSFLCSVLQIIVLLSLSFDHCIVVPSSIYGLVGFVLLDLQFSVQCFVDHCLSCCPPFFWPLYCRSFFHLWLSGVRVAPSLVFCVVFCRSLFVLFFPFF